MASTALARAPGGARTGRAAPAAAFFNKLEGLLRRMAAYGDGRLRSMVVPSITETVLSSRLAMYTRFAVASTATALGRLGRLLRRGQENAGRKAAALCRELRKWWPALWTFA